jgi:hypothetical protein
MQAVLYCRITTAIETASKGGGGMLLIVVLIVFLVAVGRYGVSSRLLAEFSGFYESPVPP